MVNLTTQVMRCLSCSVNRVANLQTCLEAHTYAAKFPALRLGKCGLCSLADTCHRGMRMCGCKGPAYGASCRTIFTANAALTLQLCLQSCWCILCHIADKGAINTTCGDTPWHKIIPQEIIICSEIRRSVSQVLLWKELLINAYADSFIFSSPNGSVGQSIDGWGLDTPSPKDPAKRQGGGQHPQGLGSHPLRYSCKPAPELVQSHRDASA